MNLESVQEQSIPKSSFMTKYYSDNDYKKKHNAYMVQKVICDCGLTVMRCNKTKHNASQKHKLIIKLYANCTPAEVQKYLALSAN